MVDVRQEGQETGYLLYKHGALGLCAGVQGVQALYRGVDASSEGNKTLVIHACLTGGVNDITYSGHAFESRTY